MKNSQGLRHITTYNSPPSHHKHPTPGNVQIHTVSAMRASLSPNRIPASPNISVIYSPTRFSCVRFPKIVMADEAENKTLSSESSVQTTEEDPKQKSESESKKPPPPPEKPDPGDCCGSGCVRCVWDVYYEELEAYEKLYQK